MIQGEIIVASVRVALKREARRLAAPVTDGAEDGDEVCISGAAVRHLYALVQTCEQPERTLRWAWRSQRRTHSATGSYVDGLAATYLLATMIHLRKADHAPLVAGHA